MNGGITCTIIGKKCRLPKKPKTKTEDHDNAITKSHDIKTETVSIIEEVISVVKTKKKTVKKAKKTKKRSR